MPVGIHNAHMKGLVYLDSAVASACTLILTTEWADGGSMEQRLNLRAGQLYDLSQYFSVPAVDPQDRVYLRGVEEGIDVNIANLGIESYGM